MESEDSPCRPNSFDFVSATACMFFVPFFDVTAHCRQQCPSCTPCQERKAQQSQQILFRGVMTPSLMPVGQASHWCWLTLPECVIVIFIVFQGKETELRYFDNIIGRTRICYLWLLSNDDVQYFDRFRDSYDEESNPEAHPMNFTVRWYNGGDARSSSPTSSYQFRSWCVRRIQKGCKRFFQTENTLFFYGKTFEALGWPQRQTTIFELGQQAAEKETLHISSCQSEESTTHADAHTCFWNFLNRRLGVKNASPECTLHTTYVAEAS